ncbi:MAG: hypothetical protein AAF748_08955 [Pseudomonadota bacterium]
MSDHEQPPAFLTDASGDPPVHPDAQHDNEHPQLHLPFTVRIGERRMEGGSLSVTQAIVSGLLPSGIERRSHPVSFRFDFEGYSVSLFIEANIEKLGGQESAQYRLRFTDPTGPHLAPLRYLLNSYIAGDVISIGRMLGYNGPTQVKPATPEVPPTLGQKLGKLMRQGALAAVSIGLIALATTVIYDRVVFAYEPHPVTLTLAGETLRATAPGQITYVNAEAPEGEVLYSIAANSGDFLSVKMPCDCDVQVFEGFFEGGTVLPGSPLVKLIGADPTLDAQAQVTFEGVARAFAGDIAELELSSGARVPVTLTFTDGEAEADGMVVAHVTIDPEHAEQLAPGDTARLRFRRQILPTWFGGQG